jgi:hypothetical protein
VVLAVATKTSVESLEITGGYCYAFIVMEVRDVKLLFSKAMVANYVLVFPVTCTSRLRAHRQNLDFYPTNITLLLNIFIIEKDIEEALANLET